MLSCLLGTVNKCSSQILFKLSAAHLCREITWISHLFTLFIQASIPEKSSLTWKKALLFGVVTARQCRECFIKKSVLHLFTPFYFKLWIPNCQVVVVSYVGVSWRKFSKKTGWLGSNVETVLGGFSKMSKEIINGKFHKKDHCKSRYAHFISSDTKIP